MTAEQDAAWQEAFEERAAIMEYCGGLTKQEAERRARLLLMSPEKQNGQGYSEFREFWKTGKRRSG